MFHSACVGSVVQVSFFLIQGHFFIVRLMVGMGDRTLVHAGVSWTALTLSVNPIKLTEQWNECCGDAIAGLLAGIFESQKNREKKTTKAVSRHDWRQYVVYQSVRMTMVYSEKYSASLSGVSTTITPCQSFLNVTMLWLCSTGGKCWQVIHSGRIVEFRGWGSVFHKKKKTTKKTAPRFFTLAPPRLSDSLFGFS